MRKGYSIDISKKKCVTPVCRGSYVNLLEARPLPESEKLAWGMQCLFPKSDPDVIEWVKEIKGVFAQVLIDKFGMEKAKTVVASIKTPIRDGDASTEADKELQGYWFMNANNVFRQPHIIGPMGKPVDPETLTVDDIYSGAWYRVMLEFWYYDKAGNKGISSSIAAAMKVKDDDNLGSGTTKVEAAGAFEGFADEAAVMATGGNAEEDTVAATPGVKADNGASEFSFL